MAAGYACMADGDPHAARWLLTSLDPPATFTACDDDFPLMMIPVLAANLDIDPDKLYDLISKYLARELAKAAKAAKALNDADPAAVHAAQQQAIANGALDPTMGTGNVAGDDAESLVPAEEGP